MWSIGLWRGSKDGRVSARRFPNAKEGVGSEELVPEVRRVQLEAGLKGLAASLPPGVERWLISSAATLSRHETVGPSAEAVGQVVMDALPSDVTVEGLVVGMARAADLVKRHWPDELDVLRWLEAAGRRGALTLEMLAAAERESGADEQSRYLSFLSHDLRGGLNGILLMIEVLKRDLAEHSTFGEQLEDLDTMRRSVLDTVGLMDRFVYAERFRRGLVRVKRERMELRTIGDQLRHQYHAIAVERGMQLAVEAAGVAEVDRILVGLIASNLLDNALKFGARSATLRLSGHGVGWTMVVEDEGGGLPPNAISVLKSTPEARSILSASGGLGLKLVALAAAAMQARVEVEGNRIQVEKLTSPSPAVAAASLVPPSA